MFFLIRKAYAFFADIIYEFIRKFRIKYPQISDEEIFNFMNIYLLNEPAENNYEKSDILFDGRIPVNG